MKTGHGGIRDIEFVIQFLQLLNGGDLPELRTGNTLEAIAATGSTCGCLTHQERHAAGGELQLPAQDRASAANHVRSANAHAARRARRAAQAGHPHGLRRSRRSRRRWPPSRPTIKTKTELNRKILDHLLHDAFGDDAETEPEVDLVLDPDPPPERIAEVLGRYPFPRRAAGLSNLMALATEKIRFLSTRRCRHFLAVDRAASCWRPSPPRPTPTRRWSTSSKVSDSLGGKGVLWELFSFNPPTLRLYVELCSSSPYLSGILISNPGMIDELMDSLVLDKLPTRESARDAGRAVPRRPKTSTRSCTASRTRSNCASACATSWARKTFRPRPARCRTSPRPAWSRSRSAEYEKLAAKLGEPTIAKDRDRPALRLVDPGDGQVRRPRVELSQRPGRGLPLRGRRHDRAASAAPTGETTTATSISSASSASGSSRSPASSAPYGRLYEVDPRLRPTGKSGALATSSPSSRRYFAEGRASSGSGKPCAKPGWCMARRTPPPGRRRAIGEAALTRRRWQTGTPRPCGRCGAGWRPAPRPAISSAGRAESSTSSSSCRCCN